MNSLATTAPDTSIEEITSIFQRLKDNQYAVGNTTVKQRRAKLEALHQAILAYRLQIKEAMFQDFRKHPSESDLTEVYTITSELKHAKRHVKKWMGKHRVRTPLAFLGSSSHIHYEPKGVVLIISPWNFPFNLTFGPLVSAVAAGNTIVVKPSEHTPHASALMKQIIEEVFEPNEVVVIEGGKEIAQELLTLPFNHIFFTGAPAIGKIVMEAAAKHLASVTLELGGKSPTIVDETANLNLAAHRIAFSKYANNGQTCVAPDYILVHKSVEQAFIQAMKAKISAFYTEDPSQERSYARVVNPRNYERIKGLVEDAVQRGAVVHTGNEFDGSQEYIAPTLLAKVPDDAEIMQEEIFGPVLPVCVYENLEEAIQIIHAREKPLSLYIYSKNRRNIEYIIRNTRAGGGAINNSAVQYYNNNLPFGGSNNSGVGKSHGWFGFEAFSNARSTMVQHTPGALDFLSPPYNDLKQKLIDLTIRYF